MQAFVRGTALWLLALAWPVAAMAADAAHCAATLSEQEQRYLQACMARGQQCTDYWPGYPDDLSDCARAQKWLAKAITLPDAMRHEIFGPMPGPAAAPAQEQAAAPAQAPPAWKNLPRSQDGSAPRAVAGNVAGATATDYAGASSKLDPEQARAAGLGFWTGQVVQIADTVALANRTPESQVPRSVPAPAPASQPTPGVGVASAGASKERPVVYANHANSTNECVELRGNTIGNRCNFDLLISWCVSQPQQTKNFFDSSGAFECGKGGGLNTIKAGGTEGNVLYGYIIYFACPYTDYYTPARMKTKYSAEGLGLIRGTCGDGDRLVNTWTVGGTLVSRPRQ